MVAAVEVRVRARERTAVYLGRQGGDWRMGSRGWMGMQAVDVSG
jgi:hypothetical protein